jgi:hypothetical protein
MGDGLGSVAFQFIEAGIPILNEPINFVLELRDLVPGLGDLFAEFSNVQINLDKVWVAHGIE